MADPTQRPPWAELNSRLEALLGRLEAPPGRGEAAGLAHECVQWHADVQAAAAAQELGPSFDARELLPRALVQAGERLAALEGQPGIDDLVGPACALIAGCTVLAEEYRVYPVSAYSACLALILTSGTRALEHTTRRVTAATRQACEHLLGAQATALRGLLAFLRKASPAMAASIVPAERLVRWWEAAAAALEALERVRGSPAGAGDLDPLAAFAEALFVITSSAGGPFGAHLAAVDRDRVLCGRLARLLLPLMAATAIGLQLPQERRPPGCTWQRAVRGSLAPLQAAQLARQLLPALPKFGPLLADAEAQGHMLLSLNAAVDLLADLMASLLDTPVALDEGTAGGPSWQANVQAWCVGVDAAVHLLHQLAPLPASSRPSVQPPDAKAGEAAAHASSSLCEMTPLAAAVIFQTVWGATPAADTSTGESLQSLWRLHSTLCRAWHASAGAGASVALESAASEVLGTADCVARMVAGADAPMAAMSAAHFELMRAVLLGPADVAAAITASPTACTNELLALGTAVLCGPAAITAHPDTRAMFAHLAAGLPERYIPLLLFDAAKDSPPAVVHLCLGGVFDVAVQNTAGTSGADRLRVLQTAMHSLEALCRAGEAADAAASSAVEPSSRALAAALEQPAAALRAALAAPAFAGAPAAPNLKPREVRSLLAAAQSQLLPPARQLAAALLQWWRRPEQAAADALELARVAAARSCSYLRCANLAGEGGPAAGEGEGSSKCSACRAVWYCDETCSHADWRPRDPTGHKAACRLLGAERAAAKAAAAAERRQAGCVSGSGDGRT